MSNVDTQRVAAFRTLEALLDAEFKLIVDARRHVGATQGGYRIEMDRRGYRVGRNCGSCGGAGPIPELRARRQTERDARRSLAGRGARDVPRFLF